jgi:hypothetical protein
VAVGADPPFLGKLAYSPGCPPITFSLAAILGHLPDLFSDLIDIDQISSIAADQFYWLAAAGEAYIFSHLSIAHLYGDELATLIGEAEDLFLWEWE